VQNNKAMRPLERAASQSNLTLEGSGVDYGSQLMYALLLAVPVACVVWTVTKEEVFREFRQVLDAFQRRARSVWTRKLGYMPTCPYCFSHYVAALFVCLFRFKMLTDDWRGYLASLFTVVLIANIYLTLYGLIRAALRREKGLADQAETGVQRASRREAVKTPHNKFWPPSVSRRDGTTSQHQNGEHVASRGSYWPARNRSRLV
jgi:hypothetical protein